MTSTQPAHTILLVEDNPLLVDAYTSALQAGGCEVHNTANGATSIKLAKRIKPDIIILDLAIHGTGGLDVLKTLKEHPDTAHVPIIILTSSENPKDRTEAESLGADGFYSKSSTSLQILHETIEKTISEQVAVR